MSPPCARRAQTRFELKGRSPLTEHYSALGPEVLTGAQGEWLGRRNEALVAHLDELAVVPADELRRTRRAKFRSMGVLAHV